MNENILQFLNTEDIEQWPSGVILGFARVEEGRDPEILTTEEREEWSAFKSDHRKKEYLAVRHLFRFMMANQGSESLLPKLKKEDSGKPYALIKKKRIHVSISHSSDCVFCAVSEDLDIGLDTEKKDRNISDKLLSRILSKEENASNLRMDRLQIWTIKEASVKKIGTGLRTNLKDITINGKQKDSIRVKINDDYSIQICSFHQLDHQIALAF